MGGHRFALHSRLIVMQGNDMFVIYLKAHIQEKLQDRL